MAEVKDNTEKYQWKKGDDFGKIVTVDHKDSKFTYFTDGSQIFNNVISEFLEKIENDVIPFPTANTSIKIEDKTPVVIQEVSTEQPTSIMGKMITKMSKKNVVSVPIQINLNIPTPALHSMLSESMEDEDLNDEIMSVALSQIELDKLQEYIKGNIVEFLKEYYS